MKLQDIIDLAKSGYKPADIFKLLEYVETSPAVQAADSGLKPDDVPPEDKIEDKLETGAKKDEEDKKETDLSPEELMKKLLS